MHPRIFCLIGTALASLLCTTNSALADTAMPGYQLLPAGRFNSALSDAENVANVENDAGLWVDAFALMDKPVSNSEFLRFVITHAIWQRDKVPSVFAEARYLQHWAGPTRLSVSTDEAANMAQQPVVNVSWFAASAYCESVNARLPRWIEWEYAAAADETRADARADPAWRERILSWYSQPSNTPLAAVGQGPANFYGVQDLHGLIWEWTEDYAAMLVSSDNREQNEQNRLKFCGAGALSIDDKEGYAVLMRVAMLSSLRARDTTANLGFRCARSLPSQAAGKQP
jgi:formylglycine-generating enzyme